ncbi:unnamed protein product, partial [marine sediment metagenome]
GSDVPRGLRSQANGVVFYVSADHPNASADADGTDPENPLTTITAAFARLAAFHALAGVQAEGSVIVVSPGTYTDSITIDSATYPQGCAIVAADVTKYDTIWAPGEGDALAIDQSNWVVDGFHFQPAADGAGVHLTWTAAGAGHGATIQNCFFDGRWGTGLYGIETRGPANVTIQNNRFAEFGVAQPCIVTRANTVSPYQNHILNNTFQECAEYITNIAEGYNACVFMYNVFSEATGELTATTTYIDLGGPGHGANVVTQNIFGGTYSILGGYESEGA